VTRSEVIAGVELAFAECPRPEHFTAYTHCAECAEHDATLRARDRDTLTLADVGNPGWDPLCFCSAAGLAYYFPALAGLALTAPANDSPWYAEQLVFHLGYGHLDNELYGYCNDAQRQAVSAVLAFLIETYAAHIEGIRAGDAYLRCHELWSGMARTDSD